MARKPVDDKLKAMGIGLRMSEWEEIEKIAASLDMTSHAVAAYAIRRFVRDWQAGKIKPEKKQTYTLPDL